MNSNVEKKIFLYKKIYNELKEKIQSSAYTYGELLPSEREIGELYGVDRTTVRKALTLLVEDNIVEKRVGKGTVVIKKSSEQMAVLPATPSNNPILFLLPKTNNKSDRITVPFYSELFYNIENSCKKFGYSLIYSTIKENEDLNHLLEQNNFMGIIFVSNSNPKHIKQASEQKIPAVILNGYDSSIPSILSDNFTGTYLACEALIKYGHQDICVLNGITTYTTAIERLRGVHSALKDYGLKLKEEYNLTAYSWELDGGFMAIRDMLKICSTHPTAIICFNDRLAQGAIQAIQMAQLRIPEDISITGFDNSEQAKYSIPKLASVEINIPMMAKATLLTLLNQMQYGEVLPLKIMLPVNFIERDSIRDLTS